MPRTWVLNKLPLSFAGHLSIHCWLSGTLQALLLALAWDPPSASQCLPLPVSPTVSRKMQTFCAQHRHVHQSATHRLKHHLCGWFQSLAARAEAVNGTDCWWTFFRLGEEQPVPGILLRTRGREGQRPCSVPVFVWSLGRSFQFIGFLTNSLRGGVCFPQFYRLANPGSEKSHDFPSSSLPPRTVRTGFPV